MSCCCEFLPLGLCWFSVCVCVCLVAVFLFAFVCLGVFSLPQPPHWSLHKVTQHKLTSIYTSIYTSAAIEKLLLTLQSVCHKNCQHLFKALCQCVCHTCYCYSHQQHSLPVLGLPTKPLFVIQCAQCSKPYWNTCTTQHALTALVVQTVHANSQAKPPSISSVTVESLESLGLVSGHTKVKQHT